MAGEYLEEVGRFFAEGSLYVDYPIVTGVNAPFYIREVFPQTIARDCEKCETRTVWERATPQSGESLVAPKNFCIGIYQCRNCQERQFRIHFWWAALNGVFTYFKIGQFPKFEVKPPKVMEKALSTSQIDLYRKGKTLRHHGYGLGSLVYFRRLVEDTTNEMLDLLVAAMRGPARMRVRSRRSSKRRRGKCSKKR